MQRKVGYDKDCTFLGGGGGFCWNANFTASAADSGSLMMLFLVSASDSTTKKWWHFSHFTKRVEAVKKENPNGKKNHLLIPTRDSLGTQQVLRMLCNTFCLVLLSVLTFKSQTLLLPTLWIISSKSHVMCQHWLQELHSRTCTTTLLLSEIQVEITQNRQQKKQAYNLK